VPGEVLLSEIKDDPQTKNIPVHVISGRLDVNMQSIAGAREFIAKPFSRDRLDQLFNDISSELSVMSSNRVLIIEDDATQQEVLKNSFEEKHIECELVTTGQEAIEQLKQAHFGTIILDLELPDTDGFKLVETLSHCTNANTPIIIYTARDLDKRQDAQLRKYARRIVLKTDKSISRLLNETTLFLHWLQGANQTTEAAVSSTTDSVQLHEMEDKKLLLVDDDIRNLYSLSAVLEECGFEIETAGTGNEAIVALNSGQHFDLVLMDVMMPEMDGLEAMQAIRQDSRFKELPIIALTAKAMKDDRARCIAAGANDYLSKPVDTNKLKAIVKMWLGQA
jgi:CheY-like chemotaxis protein